MFGFRRAVWLLGWVNLATDSATEAIYPLLPYFLTHVLGAGTVSLGIVEGAAEATNSILKIWSGRVADRQGFAFGVYDAVQGLGALAASILFGFVWSVYSAQAAFGLGAALALADTVLLYLVVPRPEAGDHAARV
jgi:MFS family permease